MLTKNTFRLRDLNIQEGRNFSRFEVQRGSNVAVIGYKLAQALYGDIPMPVGTRFRLKAHNLKL
ncbi:MAG: ABC transporter permease [Flammeovirgaceae bacterium]|nr:ABC transporter permease [Flammeovirgaceae bacterium]